MESKACQVYGHGINMNMLEVIVVYCDVEYDSLCQNTSTQKNKQKIVVRIIIW